MRTENLHAKLWITASLVPVLGIGVSFYREMKLDADFDQTRLMSGSNTFVRANLNRQKRHLHIAALIQNLATIAAIATLLALEIIEGNLYMGLCVGAGLLLFASLVRHSFKILECDEISKAIRKQWVIENTS